MTSSQHRPAAARPRPGPRPAAVISSTSGKGFAIPPPEISMPKNAASWGYSVCFGLYLATAAACFAPEVGGGRSLAFGRLP